MHPGSRGQKSEMRVAGGGRRRSTYRRINNSAHQPEGFPPLTSDLCPMSQAPLSAFAQGLSAETAFDVLAVAKRLKAHGKDVVELQIGDSPFPSTRSAQEAGRQAIEAGETHYCPSPGL